MKEEKEQTPMSHISDEELEPVAVELMETFDESFKELAICSDGSVSDFCRTGSVPGRQG